MRAPGNASNLRPLYLLATVLGVVIAAAIGFSVGYRPSASPELLGEVARLAGEVQRLRQEHSTPAMVLGRHRNSICYIYAVYSLNGAQVRSSGTGFVVGDGVVATNRHVLEPWFDDPDSEAAIRAGARPRMEHLLAFFPGLPTPVKLTNSRFARHADVAVAQFVPPPGAALRPLPLSERPAQAGQPVVVVGYPMGVAGMVAKSPRQVYQRLAFRSDTVSVARELAALALIRPSATYGHLGDIVGDKLIYDAPTAHGGSGGPVFDVEGKVVAVNAAYVDGFAGGTLGISADVLRDLLARR